MEVKIDKQEKSKIVIDFTMSKEEFEKELDKSFAKNAKHFKVPGFRNGKVPRAIVEKTYGENVLFESVIEDNVDEEYRKVVEDNKLEIVSKPELDVKQIGKGKDLIYTVTCYVKPEVEVKGYKGITIDKIDSKITDKDIEDAIEQIREKNARIVSVEDRALKLKDISTIDFEGFVDGIAFEGGKGENFELTIGSGQFIPGFEEQLVGMNIGEEKDITVKFPEEYHSNDLAGKDAIFKVKLIAIKENILPELDDEFAKDVSEYETLEEYKNSIKEKVATEKENRVKAEKETKILDKLVENTVVEIPQPMIDDEVANSLEQFSSNLSYQGLTIEKYCEYVGSTVDAFKETMIPNAQKDVKLKLALEFIAKAEDIKVEESEIDEKVIELASQYGNDNTNSESLLKNPNVREYMKNKLLQDKSLAIVVDNAIEK